MTVADLRQYFEGLARLVHAAPAAKASEEIEHIRRGLAPFQNLSLKEFGDFLIRADEFARTGQVSAAPPKGRTRASVKAPASPKPTASALGLEAKRLYELAATASVTDADLDELSTKLQKLTIPGLIAVGAAIGMVVRKGPKKDQIVREIRARIESQQGSKQRSGMTSPPTSSTAEMDGSETFAASMGAPGSS